MNTKELQLEIQVLLDRAPENVLAIVLRFLQEIQERGSDSLDAQSRNLDQIFEEDQELLEKLAS
jgi:hypothetical protein